ncbi:Lipin_N domain-containing protein/LNS2 domain-containing protein [Cephalotus follicularis]|uniref:phosphatidate phosphatase n=1 Tax=Cephalotus follicularis TaxID=3775 RepID=A0A1Q3BB00_CEPFO|nr:Lipin_N domain-containing protein/LNS2 domain-containing protein [Cephalotus follicularis]
MNVVGKVGSLISQGVYSVATPFHPFGGAVDVIVVKQQDGTFRSTPWYVRFGKFQGVLKGAEKVVRIAVNGIEANFHMYLDNSGEAYFIREVESGKESEANRTLRNSDTCADVGIAGSDTNIGVCRLEHSVSDTGVLRLRDECVPSLADRLERAESESDRRFYDFQDEQSSLDGSVELSEYGSGRYESLDCENLGVQQNLNSEVVLVSVDGHVLTAPISVSEQDTENVQLSTPQFHLGPGEGTEFVEGNEEFSSGDNAWAADYIRKLNSCAANVASDNVCSMNDGDNASGSHQEVCEGDGEHDSITEKPKNIANEEADLNMHCDADDASTIIKREDVFKSCLELTELAKHIGDANIEKLGLSVELQDSPERSHDHPEVDETEERVTVELRNCDSLLPSCSFDSSDNNESPDLQVKVEPSDKNMLGTEKRGSNNVSVIGSDSPSNNGSPNMQVEAESIDNNVLGSDSVAVHSIGSDPEWKDEQLSTSAAIGEMGSSMKGPVPLDDSSITQIVEPQIDISSEVIQTHSSINFEISFCRNELHEGMGLAAAAEVFNAHRISAEEYNSSAASIIKNENLIVRYKESYLTWEKAAPLVLGKAAFGLDLPVEPKEAVPVEYDDTLKPRDDTSGVTSSPSGRRWRLWPIPFRRVKTLEHTSSNSSTEEVFVDSESCMQNSLLELTTASSGSIESPHKQFIRTNVPTNEQIASLNLKEGQNMVTFSFSTRVLGTQEVDAHIYLWKWNARIVISDVDGTITKSDVLGQFMPLVGKDWSQSGVARLFSAIKENGYQLLFLSARAIVQAYLTRNFLLNLKQDGKALPNGPIVISPDGLFPSLFREVIRRAPHEFKIACLEDIRKLFPSDYNPFYAGFGNRDTDELSYRKIGIPKGKIFIINPKGEVAISHRIDAKSYTSLHTLVNDMFPPTSLVEQEDYNSWNFWRVPMLEIE